MSLREKKSLSEVESVEYPTKKKSLKEAAFRFLEAQQGVKSSPFTVASPSCEKKGGFTRDYMCEFLCAFPPQYNALLDENCLQAF